MKILHALCAAACLAAPVPAQVIINEVFFTRQTFADDEWIELRNTGVNTVDLSTWSVYVATDTFGLAKNYWFGFPGNTQITPGGILRVHWMAPVQPSTATDVYTGNTVFHFLFGFGAEELGNAANAAIALLNSQSNQLMNSSVVFQDWITWGDGWTEQSRPAREDLAIQAGLWNAATAVDDSSISAPTADTQSLALDYNKNAEPTASTAFFHDASPTPPTSGTQLSGHNHEFAEFSVIDDPNNPGTPLAPCVTGFGTAANVSTMSVSASGNVDFGLRIDNLVPGQLAALLIGVSSTTIPWVFGPSCSINVMPIATCPFNISGPSMDFPISLEIVPPGTIYVQTITLGTIDDIGFDPGHKWVIGN